MQTHSSVSSRPFVQSYQESPISLGSIEKNTGNRKSVFLDDQDLTRGFTVIHGGPGSGKSVLARSIALQHLQRGGALLYLNLEGLPALQDALPNVSLSTDSVDGAFSVLPPRALLQRLAPSANQTTAGSHAIDAVLPVFSLTIDIVQARNGIIHVSEICELLQDPQRLEEGIPDLAYKDREIHAHAVDCFRDSETKELCLDRYHQVVDPFVHRLQDLLGNHYDDISGNYASWQNLVSVVLERRSCEASVQDSWAPKRQSFLLSAFLSQLVSRLAERSYEATSDLPYLIVVDAYRCDLVEESVLRDLQRIGQKHGIALLLSTIEAPSTKILENSANIISLRHNYPLEICSNISQPLSPREAILSQRGHDAVQFWLQ